MDLTTQSDIFRSWNFMRWTVLTIGIIFMVQAVRLWDAASALIAAFFLFQAITNTGCLVGSCGISSNSGRTGGSNSRNTERVTFTEIEE